MGYEVKKVQMDEEFKICPECGYQDGFHSMFKQDGVITKWFFICPSCHSVFDIGLSVPGNDNWVVKGLLMSKNCLELFPEVW